ncbi:DUF7426 family protein [Actinokineospora enzanensis]|uniref:DUF7426 family protein n=1 Tax=Actinokineospora enzanensis TaxID=155975 RepID=UPI00037CCCF0|nr:hypothetical protein [Actinokineospora enzanensis]
MTTFPDLSTLGPFVEETEDHILSLPVHGTVHTWRGALPWTTGLRVRLLRERAFALAVAQEEAERTGEPLDATAVADLPETDWDAFEKQIVGEDFLARAADDPQITEDDVARVYQTVLTWKLYGKQAALAVWTEGLRGGDARPPAEGSGSTRTPDGSSTKTTRSRSTGARSSRAGISSKRASTRSTTST